MAIAGNRESSFRGRVFLSGVDDGQKRSGGSGTARSLKMAFPDIDLVAVASSLLSTGMHSDQFDQYRLRDPWDQLQANTYRNWVGKTIEDSHFLPGFDLEVRLLAELSSEHARYLGPTNQTLDHIAKPATNLAQVLGLETPPTYVVVDLSSEVVEFCEKYEWDIWLKGVVYGAARVRDWVELQKMYLHMTRTWTPKGIHLQANVLGEPESIVFVALNGESLGGSCLRHPIMSRDGRIWGGEVSSLSKQERDMLQKLVKVTAWTGAGEIEILRNQSTGQKYLLEVNPRFPEWIHGVTMSGINLPALLLAASTNTDIGRRSKTAFSAQFVREITDIQVRDELFLTKSEEQNSSGYQPKMNRELLAENCFVATNGHEMSQLARQLNGGSRNAIRGGQFQSIGPFHDQLDKLSWVADDFSTPLHLFSVKHFKTRLAKVRSRLDDVDPIVNLAYSVKTNRSDEAICAAKDCGLLLETISLSEVQRCLHLGVDPERIIVTGPAKSWKADNDKYLVIPVATYFADGLSELKQVGQHDPDGYDLAKAVCGFRIRPDQIESRFGIPTFLPEILEAVEQIFKSGWRWEEFGLHLHLPVSFVGVSAWRNAIEQAICLGNRLEDVSGAKFRLLDLGGGWSPTLLDSSIRGIFDEVVVDIRKQTKNLTSIQLELGKSLVETSGAVLTRVVDVNRYPDRQGTIIVDTSTADIAEMWAHPHRIMWSSSLTNQHSWARFGTGDDIIAGRLCMERDVIAGQVAIPAQIGKGDYILVRDTGGYDSSMKFAFGC